MKSVAKEGDVIAKLKTSIRQVLRKRWVVLSTASFCLLLGYCFRAGQITGLAFHPRAKACGIDQDIRDCVLNFYKPVFLAGGSNWCPEAFSQFQFFCMGKQRQEIGDALIHMARLEIKKSSYDRAERFAKFVDHVDLFYDVFDDRPELVFDDLQRIRQGKSVGAKSTVKVDFQIEPSPSSDGQIMVQEPRDQFAWTCIVE